MTTWIVCGGRHYANVERVDQILDAAVIRLQLTRLVEGGATGADALARAWRIRRGVEGQSYEAAWNDLSHPDAFVCRNSLGKLYDSLAGFRRNQEMIDKEHPAGILAFRGGAGTEDMIRRGQRAGIRVITIDWKYPP
jgi:hypothetical protein